MTKQFPTIFGILLIIMITGCSGASSSSDSSDVDSEDNSSTTYDNSSRTGIDNSDSDSDTGGNSDTDNGNNNDDGPVDITNIVLSNTSNNCSDYTGEYIANVTDINRNVAYSSHVQISLEDDHCSFTVNEIPNHDFHDGEHFFATDTSEQNGYYEVPADPQVASSITNLTLGITNALFLNGVTVDILAAACYDVGNESLGREKVGCGPDQIDNPWRYDPMSPLNGFGTDSHNAHTQPDGTYHYHGNPLALYDQQCEENQAISPVIGFAADGFPIYGPCINDSGTVRKAQSSYRLKDNGGPRQTVAGYSTPVEGVGEIASNNYDGQFRGDYEYISGLGDLDECNGMTINGLYGYFITDKFPWVLGCYKGEVDPSFSAFNQVQANYLSHQHEELIHSHF